MVDTEKRTCRDECLSGVNTACLVQMVRLVRWGDAFSLWTKVALFHISRRVGKALAGQDDSFVGTQRGDGRRARINPPE